MNLLLLEPYFTGSHKAWAEGYAGRSKHEVKILSLAGQFWKWRMHGGAVTLARQFLERDLQPDVILATDMLDLTTFLSLTRRKTADIPTALYFHENQLTYPWSPTDRDVQQNRDRHYGFINYASALTADAVFFNSNYHRNSFLTELRRFLQHFPDHRDPENIDRIAEKSEVLPLGLDLARFDAQKPPDTSRTEPPLVLWNHRWEFDKNPEAFFRALYRLADKDIDFRVAVLGECFSQQPQVFEQAQQRLGERIVQFGYLSSFADYAHWLWQSDILPVTSYQDFFGASVAEALYCECLPLLPRRLAYPELIPTELHPHTFYYDFDDLVRRLQQALTNVALQTAPLRAHVQRFDWSVMAAEYDHAFAGVLVAHQK